MTNRFEVDTGDKGLMIYDHDGVDDYYFVNDEKELQEFCDLINERERKIQRLENDISKCEVLLKQLDFQTGSEAYLTVKALAFEDILYIKKDVCEPGTVRIYVKKNYSPFILKSFVKLIPLGIHCKFFVVSDVKSERIFDTF